MMNMNNSKQQWQWPLSTKYNEDSATDNLEEDCHQDGRMILMTKAKEQQQKIISPLLLP